MEPYTENELFNLRTVEVEADTIVDRFNAKLVMVMNGQEEAISKRKFYVKDLKGSGYLGFDAYNHNVSPEITQRIRVTYIGKDYVCVFVRTPEQGNVPSLIRVTVGDYQEVCSVDCGNNISYKLLIRAKS